MEGYEKAARVGEVMVSSLHLLCVCVVPAEVGGEVGLEEVRFVRPVAVTVSVPGAGIVWLVRGVV